MEARDEITFKAKLCRSCLSPEVIFTSKHLGESNIRKKAWEKEKSPYTCTFRKCAQHLWICKFHKGLNGPAIQKVRQELQRKGLVMGHPRVLELQSWSGDTEKAAKATKSDSFGLKAVSSNKDADSVKDERLENKKNLAKSDEKGKLRRFLSNAR